MEHQLLSKLILRRLGITKSYSGYDYILYGLSLIEQDELCLSSITKVLYIDIAKKFQTSHSCVERNIRKVVEVIWKNNPENKELIQQIFGSKHVVHKPTNREFLDLLYEYVTIHSTLENLISHHEPIQCPISKKPCDLYGLLLPKIQPID